MELTTREETIWNELIDWEESLFKYQPNDLSVLYEKWLELTFSLLPDHTKETFFSKLDHWLFHLHGLMQSSQIQIDARDRILVTARIFNEDIMTIRDLKRLSIDQLNYIANQQMVKHRMYSFAQGGVSGSGGILLLSGDIPAMAIINIRIVQLVAMTYGYEVNKPVEMMLALKVFHAGMMPKRLQSEAWKNLIEEMKTKEDDYFYVGNEELTNASWLEQPLKQVLKSVAITMFRKKKFQGIPLISMAIGAGTNYEMTRKLSEFAQKFYQYRYLFEKQNNK